MPGEHTRYSRLANLTKLINTRLELREVLEHVATAIAEEIVQCDSVGIYLPQENGTYRGYVGKPDVINGMTLDMHVVDPEVDLLAKEVVQTRKVIYIPDTSIDNRPDPRAIEAFQIKSLLGLPISYDDELYGLVFLFDYGIPMNLTESEIQTVEAYVNMAAVAIRNANNLARKESVIAEKQLLLDVTRDLSMCTTVQEVLDKCFHYVGQVLNNSNIGIHLLDPAAEKKLKPARLSKDSDWTEEEWLETHGEIKLDHSKDLLFQEVIQTKKAILVPDVFADPRPNHEACRKFGIKGLFMMPLVAMGQVLGTIPVVNLEEKGKVYPEADIQLAQYIVDATASALFNLLYKEKQELIIQERTSEIINKHKELQEAVSELQRLSREKELILNSAGEGIFGLNLEGNITFCNPAAVSMLGYNEKDELIGQSCNCIFGPIKTKDQSTFFAYIEQNTHHHNREEQFVRKDGSCFPVEYIISSIKEADRAVGYVVTFNDITSRKKMEEEIKYHAYYDSLTNLPNRVLFKERLNQGLQYAKLHGETLAVMFLDLDRFKMINDTLGHSYGDCLLKEVANRLKSCIPMGATVSRQGGDEFILTLPGISKKEEVITVAECILDSFTPSFNLNGDEVFIKTSIGISLFPHDGDDADTLIRNADMAMYKSKELSGNNYQFYATGMDPRTVESIKLENDLYRALDYNEFEVYYQPQIDYQTNKIVRVEALLRWNHSKKGIIPPNEFIPIAEETGLIIPIGEWILRSVGKQLKLWHDAGYSSIGVAVNLSARQFEQRNLVAVVKEILEETELPPHCLELELTENLIVKNTEVALKTMQQLRDLGIEIAIDDFGTGYSSLGYLKKFPMNTLKIDKAFIEDVVGNTHNAAITNTIITLSHNLNLNVIAEGVETKEQADFLVSHGCHLMQGYFFSRPIKAEEFTRKYLSKEGAVYF